MLKKKALVIHSGGMDSSICLALAVEEFGAAHILSVSFSYYQRHSIELEAAKTICSDWNVDHVVIDLACLQQLTENALINPEKAIEHPKGEPPNTLVTGRNGLMARLGAIHAESLGADRIYMGVIEVEEANSGYRDCSRRYMDMMEKILQIDLANPHFTICTPLVYMTKKETMKCADQLGILDYLLEETVSCYEGKKGRGCSRCPACLLRNEGIDSYRQSLSQ